MLTRTFMSSIKVAGLLITCAFGIVSIIATGGGGGSDNSIQPKPTTGTSISGIASKGPIDGGTVNAYAINPIDGSKGDLKGTSTTNSDGTFTIDLGDYVGDVIIEVTGGSYTDEATNSTMTNSLMRTVLANVSGNVTSQVTPLTELAVQTIENKTSGAIDVAQIDSANALVSNIVGTDILTTPPADVLSPTANTLSPASQSYGLALASISEMVKLGYATDTADAIAIIADDLKTDKQLETTRFDLTDALDKFNTSGNNRASSDSVTQLNLSIETYAATPIPDTAFTMNDLAGTWNSVRFESPAFDVSGDHNAGADTLTVQADGSFTVTCLDTSEPPCGSPISGSGIAVSTIGAMTFPSSPDVTDYSYMSSGKNLVAGLSVDNDTGEQLINLFAKRASSYSLADLEGTWIGMALKSPAPGGSANDHGFSVQRTVFQNDGSNTITCIASSDGCGPTTTTSGLTIDNSGFITVTGLPTGVIMTIAVAADKNVALQLHRLPGTHQLYVSVKQAASYSMADLAGTWQQVQFQSPTKDTLVDATVVGGHGASIGKAIIAEDGSYAFTCVYADYGCHTPVETGPPDSIAITADGTISGSGSSPTTEYWAMSAGKDVMVQISVNATNENQALSVFVKTGS